jgi:hypothetical protein
MYHCLAGDLCAVIKLKVDLLIRYFAQNDIAAFVNQVT